MFVRNILLGVTLFHFFSKNCILFWITRIISVLFVSALRCFSINVGYYVYWNVVPYRFYLLCRDRKWKFDPQIIIWAKCFLHYLSFLFDLRNWIEWIINMEILNWVIPLIHFPSHLSSIQAVLMSVYLVIQILFGFLLQVFFLHFFPILFGNGLTFYFFNLLVVIRFLLQNLWSEWDSWHVNCLH